MTDLQALLREDLLADGSVLAAPRTALVDACAALGARVAALDADLLDEAATQAAAVPADVLVVDGGALFGAGGPEALRSALDGAWSAVHAHFDATRASKVLLVAPRSGAGAHAEAARAGLENLARTTSIEWARFGIRTAAILPGPAATDADVGTLIAWLASPAGDYVSGTALTLG